MSLGIFFSGGFLATLCVFLTRRNTAVNNVELSVDTRTCNMQHATMCSNLLKRLNSLCPLALKCLCPTASIHALPRHSTPSSSHSPPLWSGVLRKTKQQKRKESRSYQWLKWLLCLRATPLLWLRLTPLPYSTALRHQKFSCWKKRKCLFSKICANFRWTIKHGRKVSSFHAREDRNQTFFPIKNAILTAFL